MLAISANVFLTTPKKSWQVFDAVLNLRQSGVMIKSKVVSRKERPPLIIAEDSLGVTSLCAAGLPVSLPALAVRKMITSCSVFFWRYVSRTCQCGLHPTVTVTVSWWLIFEPGWKFFFFLFSIVANTWNKPGTGNFSAVRVSVSSEISDPWEISVSAHTKCQRSKFILPATMKSAVLAMIIILEVSVIYNKMMESCSHKYATSR